MKFRIYYSFFLKEKMIVWMGMVYFLFSGVSFGYALPTHNANAHDVKVKLKEENASHYTSLVEHLQQPIRGTVRDENGMPLPGVNITIEGTSHGTQTNFDGNYSINAEEGEVLHFSFVGFQEQSVPVGSEIVIDITLEESASALDEVVVVGYGTQRKRDVTGAIESLGGEKLNEMPTVDLSQGLQGRISGLTVTNNGSPGASPKVNIRGISSISYSSNPLYVIDGMPVDNLSDFDNNDVESIDVLKDASSAAIYGSRGTNGVVMITTKKGSGDGKMHISYNGSYGNQWVSKRLDLMNTRQIQEYAMAYRGSALPRLSSPWDATPIYEGASQTYAQTDVDWQDAYFRRGDMTSHNIGVSGSNEVSKYYMSAGFFNQSGTTPVANFERYNFRINSEHKISETFTFGENLYLSVGDRNFFNDFGVRTGLVNTIRMFPFIPVHDPTSIGGYRGVNPTLDGGDPTNPIEDAKLKANADDKFVRVMGTSYLDVKIADWLSFRSTFGADYNNNLMYQFAPIFDDNGAIAGSSSTFATVTNNRTITNKFLFTEQLTFDHTINDHHINVVAAYEQQAERGIQENANGHQSSNDLQTLNNASNTFVETLTGKNVLRSYIGRISYDFRGKYLIGATIRRDGLSIWAPGNKWQTFPSVSAGWNIDQEDFMESSEFFSALKLRAGYGVTGLNGVVLGNTPWSVSVSSKSAAYPFNNVLSAGSASSIQGLGNEDLEWETTKQINVGLDFGVLNNKLTGALEYYQRKTDNLILSVPLPSSFGYLSSSVNQNAGAMENSGFEAQINYNDNIGDLNWSAGFNVAFTKNKVTRLAEGISNIEAGGDDDFGAYNITNTAVGHSVQSFYGWIADGIFQSEDEVANHATQVSGETSPGDLIFRDLDGSGNITEDDRTFLGSFIPKVSYGFNVEADYKGFDFSAFFQGVEGNKVYNATRVITEGMVRFFNAGTQVLDAWTPSNTDTDIPRAAQGDPNQNSRPSTRFLEDGSYLRLKNIMLGYTLPDKALKSISNGVISNFRIYVSAQNLVTFTKYSGYDPEVGSLDPDATLTNGIDFAVYPQPKAYQVGLQIKF